MKIPKKIKMFGYEWKVIIGIDKNKDGGGLFNWTKKIIKINRRYGDQDIILLHEIIEAILLENLVRYYGNEGNTEYKFIFNHTEFCKIVKDIYQILKDNDLLKD
jgi:hypothetical protein